MKVAEIPGVYVKTGRAPSRSLAGEPISRFNASGRGICFGV